MFGVPENQKNTVHEDEAVLLEYSAQKLNANDTTRVEAHLKCCTECRRVTEEQRAVWEALDAWEPAPVSSDFDRRLYQRIEKEVSWLDRLMRPFRPLFGRHGLPIAATACLLLVAGMLLQRPSDAPAPGAPPAITADEGANALQEMEMLRELSHIAPVDNSQPKM
jgi:hypothetical protein